MFREPIQGGLDACGGRGVVAAYGSGIVPFAYVVAPPVRAGRVARVGRRVDGYDGGAVAVAYDGAAFGAVQFRGPVPVAVAVQGPAYFGQIVGVQFRLLSFVPDFRAGLCCVRCRAVGVSTSLRTCRLPRFGEPALPDWRRLGFRLRAALPRAWVPVREAWLR